jgi:4-amino-4-deoxy-L-arabinose transferase-like glycosyltransferase
MNVKTLFRSESMPNAKAFFLSEHFRLQILPAIAILLLAPAYWIYFFAPAVGMIHDDGIYLITAQSLAHGSGYRIVSLPSEIAQTKYPILYPAILSALIRLFPRFPQNLPLLKAFSFICTVLWCGASYKLLRKTSAARWASWILFFTLTSPLVLAMSAMLVPDMFFALLSIAAVLLLTRILSKPASAGLGPTVWAGLVCGAAFLARSAGIPLILAAIIILLWRRRYRETALFAVACAIVCFPWLLWQNMQPAPPLNSALMYYSKLSYAGGNIFGHYTLGQISHIVPTNVLFIFASFLSFMGGELLGILGSIVVWVFIAWGFTHNLRSGLTIVNTWVLLYLAMLLCWVNPLARYETPLLPFLLSFLIEGLRSAVNIVPDLPKWRRPLSACLIFIFAVRAGITLTTLSVETLRKGVPSVSPPEEVLNWSDMMGLAKWLRENTRKDAVVSATLDPVFYLFTQRKAIRPLKADLYELPFEHDRESWHGSVEDRRQDIIDNNINYIVITPVRSDVEKIRFKILERLIVSKPEAFQIVREQSNKDYRVYAVKAALL